MFISTNMTNYKILKYISLYNLCFEKMFDIFVAPKSCGYFCKCQLLLEHCILSVNLNLSLLLSEINELLP